MNTFLTPALMVECLLYEGADGGKDIPWMQAEKEAIAQWVNSSGNLGEWSWDARRMVLTIKERDGTTSTVNGIEIANANPKDWRFNRIRHMQKTAGRPTNTTQVATADAR